MGNILITGDFLPTDSNMSLFKNGDIQALFGDKLEEIFKKSDFRIINLEGPLTDSREPIWKSGSHLRALPESIETLKKLHIDCCSLANNHIMDYGDEGLLSTCKLLSEAGIRYVGAGNNLIEAGKPCIFEIDKKKVGIFSCAEYEFSIATEHTSGANPFDPLDILDEIQNLNKMVDYVIVLYHGGKEYYRYPAPYLQKRCRKMAEKGADLIICQHSHCIGCMEKFHNSTIIYGQGNFIFDRGENEFRNTGLIITLDSKNWEININPVIKSGNSVRLAENQVKQNIMNDFYKRSEEIKIDGFIEKLYYEFAEKKISYYECQSMGLIGKIFRKLRINDIAGKCLGLQTKIDILNSLRCEAHNDLYVAGLIRKIWNEERHW